MSCNKQSERSVVHSGALEAKLLAKGQASSLPSALTAFVGKKPCRFFITRDMKHPTADAFAGVPTVRDTRTRGSPRRWTRLNAT